MPSTRDEDIPLWPYSHLLVAKSGGNRRTQLEVEFRTAWSPGSDEQLRIWYTEKNTAQTLMDFNASVARRRRSMGCCGGDRVVCTMQVSFCTAPLLRAALH